MFTRISIVSHISAGQCVDLDNDFGDYQELDCTKYNGFTDYCGDYNDNAEEMCCACGGGIIIQPGKM